MWAESQATCFPNPISVAIKNVTVANGAPNAVARGMTISVGTPPQDIVFMPLWYNNSFIFDNINFCSVPSGNTFPGLSGIVAADPSSPSTTIYQDSFTLNAQVSLPNYTFEVPLTDWGEQYYTPSSMIGLGINSTFLQILKSQKLIASRSWSFFWGRTGRGQQSDGSVVFGGFDKSKVLGTTNYTQALNYTNCHFGTSIEISKLGLLFLDGSTTSLYNVSSDKYIPLPLYACIDPGEIGMANNPYYNYFGNFVDITGYDSFDTHSLGGGMIRSNGYSFWDILYLPGDKPFLGDINVAFKNGPSIRIKNEELVVPHVYLNQATSTWQQDTSLSDLRLNSNPDQSMSNQMKLGREFLTYVYLMINLDSGTLTIWPAFGDATDCSDTPDTSSNTSSSSTSSSSPTVTSNPTSTGAPQTTSSSNTTTTASSATEFKLSTGAIVGIIVGAIAISAMVLAGVLYFIIKKKRRLSSSSTSTPEQIDRSAMYEVSGNNDAKSLSGINPNDSPFTLHSESAQDIVQPHEMAAS